LAIRIFLNKGVLLGLNLATGCRGYLIGKTEGLEKAPFSSPEMAAHQVPIVFLDEVDSTNSYVARVMRERADARMLLVVSRSQTAGRGRLGRPWLATPGSALLASVGLRVPDPGGDLFSCPALVSLAVLQALREAFGIEAMLKWPNDIVVALEEKKGRRDWGGLAKLGGVLTEVEEAVGASGPELAVVVGVGVNLVLDPPGSQGRRLFEEMVGVAAAAVSDAAEVQDGWAAAKRLAQVVASRLVDSFGYPPCVPPFATVRKEYEACLSTLGRRVRVMRPGKPDVSGLAVGIGEAGELLVETKGGLEAVAAGDVEHLRDV
jgi:BirA family biotin operon repressor/biotin-[acetyl-CoA-carboxylase] ligase